MPDIQDTFVEPVDELSLLDLLVTLAENIKLLIVGSLLAALCALGIAFALPQTFQSVAVLQAEQGTASLMTTATVLDPVIASLALGKDEPVEEARRKLRETIKVAVGRTDKLLTLTVSANTPQQAQAIANAVLQQTYLESRPKGVAATRLVIQLKEAQTRLKNAQNAGIGVFKRMEFTSYGGAELARGYAELLSAASAAQIQISALEGQLDGVTDSQLVQSPTLPKKASQPKKGLVAISATLAAGFLLLLFIFTRQALRNTLEDGAAAGKVARIRRALRLR